MILVGIDIDKNRHTFSIIDKETGEILANPSVFNNSQEGFLFLIRKLSSLTNQSFLSAWKIPGIITLPYPDIFLTVAILLLLSTQQLLTLPENSRAALPKTIPLIL